MNSFMTRPTSFFDGHFQEYLAQRAKLFDPSRATQSDHVGSTRNSIHYEC